MMVFSTNSQERMRLDSNGNFGIGVDNPAFRIESEQRLIPAYYRISRNQQNGQGWQYVMIWPKSHVEKWLLEQDSNSYCQIVEEPNTWYMSPELVTLMLLKF